MNRKLFLLICATTLLSACSLYRVDSDETSTDFFPSKPSAKEIVYLETVTQPYEVLGTVSVNTERRTERSEVLEKIKREAALIGGDAVTNVREKPPVHKGILQNAYLRTNYLADVIKFKTANEPAKPVAKP